MKFIDSGGLADTGVSGNEHQLRPSAGYDTVEGGEQRIDLGCSPIQFLGNQQPVRYVVLAGCEFVDTASSFPFGETAPKVALGTGGGLVALLSSLGEQLHNDRRDGAWEVFQPLAGRRR